MKILDLFLLLVAILILGNLGLAVLNYDEHTTVVSSEGKNYTISEIYKKNPELLDFLYFDSEGKECRLIAINPNIVYTNNNISIYSVKLDRNGEGKTIRRKVIYYISIQTPISPLPSKVKNDDEKSGSHPSPGAYPVVPKLF